ncbi:MAG: hypothetical protein HY459_02040 [Parcubacteria group bacterium]|nr:hypothetical protein [Parcubacteria group bacterium]
MKYETFDRETRIVRVNKDMSIVLDEFEARALWNYLHYRNPIITPEENIIRNLELLLADYISRYIDITGYPTIKAES